MNVTIPKLAQKTLSLPIKETILRTAAIAVLSSLKIYNISPIGLALAAATLPDFPAAAVLGMGIGCSLPGHGGLKYLLSLIIYYVLSFGKKSIGARLPRLTLCLSAAAVFAVDLLIFTPTPSGAFFAASEIVICIGLFSLFISKVPRVRQIADIIVLGGILCTFSEVTLPIAGLHPTPAAIIFILLCLCYTCDTPTAAIVCASLVFIAAIARDDAVELCGAAVISSLFAALSADAGRIGAGVGLLCGISIVSLCRGRFLPLSPSDIFTPLIIFILLPEKVHYIIGSFFTQDGLRNDVSFDGKAAAKLRSVASALSELGRGIAENKTTEENIPTATDIVLERVCRPCPHFNGCPNANSNRLFALAQILEQDGFCDRTNLPDSIRLGCIKSESLLCEFRHAYELDKQSALFSGEAGADRNIIARQYAEISQALTGISNDLSVHSCNSPEDTCRLKAVVTAKSRPKIGNSICGDTLVHFKSGGSYFVILCDGMGSGEGAAHQSRLAAGLFEQLITAGFDKTTALGMINSALALKSDRESFSTADILEIDLSCGDAELLKIGSAQSLIKSASGIETISSHALPIGILEQVNAEPKRCHLFNGDIILMLSDGICEAGNGILKNEWLKKLLTKSHLSDEELCDAIISGAVSRSKYSDDMTCCVIRLKRNRGECDVSGK